METIKKYWFLISTVLLAIVYFVLDKRNRDLEYTISELRRKGLLEQLKKIEEKSKGSEKEYDQALKEYTNLKRRHGVLINKLGLLNNGNGPGAA
jgi:hypothetical protein